MKIIPYKMASGSAKALSEALNAKRVRQEGPQINLRDDFLINWGCSRITRDIHNVRLLNKPEAVAMSVNKLSAFIAMEEGDVDVPEFTTDPAEAQHWFTRERKVVCRTKLSSYGGDGIVIANNEPELVEAPLYVRYIPKEQEYRVHVFRGNVFFAQRKARKLDVPDGEVNWQVRNLAGGFIYANQAIEAPQAACRNAVAAVTALELDFGAVDVVVTATGKCYVLEVNCAPGLAGSTLEKYVEVFKNLSPNS